MIVTDILSWLVYLTIAILNTERNELQLHVLWFFYPTGYLKRQTVKTTNGSWGRELERRSTHTTMHIDTEAISRLGLLFTTILKENVHSAAAN